MIKDLIVRLMEEANEEAEHKGWCDIQLSTNEQTRKEKTAAVETLHAEIDELSASIAKLTQEITDLTAEIAELDKAVAEATEIREKEKAENTVTISDSQDAQTAVAQAVTVLKEFYEKAAEAEAQKSYDEFSSESAVNRAANTKDVEHKTTKKTNEESALTSKKADLEGTQKELDAALAYYDKLKPSCVDAGVSYEDRVGRRKEEIESLQE